MQPLTPNKRVQDLVEKLTTTTHFTEEDFLELALVALDQAGASATLQRRIADLLSGELGRK